jgi:protein-S-isoprenylcysteine O-methyltransferase Ste14
MFLVVSWSVFLFAIPMALSIAEVELGIQRFPPLPNAGFVLLLASTVLTVWASMTLAIKGDGSPLPFDGTRALVVSGPYALIRHPFVLGIVGQIVAFGVVLGSVPVLVYAAVAMTVWYYGVRPREEAALEERFGAPARDYRRRVRGFRPF